MSIEVPLFNIMTLVIELFLLYRTSGPDEELREFESLSLAIIIMFCIRGKVLLLDINQQNDKPTQ